MKRYLILTLAFIIVTLTTFEASAQTQVSSYTGEIKFKILILGTRYRSDIDSIIKSLSKSPSTHRVTPTVVSQNHLEFEGSYTGSEKSLVQDVSGLAMNRFSVSESKESGGVIRITLKKIQPIATSTTTTGQ